MAVPGHRPGRTATSCLLSSHACGPPVRPRRLGSGHPDPGRHPRPDRPNLARHHRDHVNSGSSRRQLPRGIRRHQWLPGDVVDALAGRCG